MKIGDEEYMDTHELGKKMNVSYKTVNNWISKGQIPSVKIGKKRYFSVTVINDWLLQKMEV